MNKFQKYLVGTLFDEEEQDKKTNLSNMKAKDPMGNTRWKGAFTGGFEAGYKNTCGSKQGWAPATFVSSIYKKAQISQRTIHDYMDKQDLGRQSITQNIVLNNHYQIAKNDTLNISLQESIGERILNRLKKMEAHRTAPQNKEDLEKLFHIYAQQDKQKPVYHLKDLMNPLTVGASLGELQIDDFIEAYDNFYKKVIREHAKEETEEEIKKRREENKIYFDFTRPLQDEPQYLKEIQEIQEAEKPRKRKKNLINQQTLKSIYSKGSNFKQFTKSEQIEKAPEQYDPYAKMRGLEMIGKPKQEHKQKHLTVENRSNMLGQVKLSNKFVSSQNSLSNRFVSNEQKVKESAKYFQDERKNNRFHEYIQQMQGKKISSQLEYLSYEESQKQRNQFEKTYQQHKATLSKQAKALNKHIQEALIKKQGNQTFTISRRVDGWRPEKLLCKRFNVLTPYTAAKKQQNPRQSLYS